MERQPITNKTSTQGEAQRVLANSKGVVTQSPSGITESERDWYKWHSMSTGISWLAFLPVPYVIIYIFIEPAVGFIAGLVVFFLVEKSVGVWLYISSICLFTKNVMEFYAERGRLLDMIDAAIEAEHLIAVVVEGAPAENADGWRVIGVTTKNSTSEQRESLARSIERADQIRQREDLAGEFAEAISNTTLKVLNVPTESEKTPEPAPAE